MASLLVPQELAHLQLPMPYLEGAPGFQERELDVIFSHCAGYQLQDL